MDREQIHEEKLELDSLRGAISQHKIDHKELEVEMTHLLERVELFDVESQILSLEDALEEAKEDYDRLLTLRTIVAAYDRKNSVKNGGR